MRRRHATRSKAAAHRAGRPIANWRVTHALSTPSGGLSARNRPFARIVLAHLRDLPRSNRWWMGIRCEPCERGLRQTAGDRPSSLSLQDFKLRPRRLSLRLRAGARVEKKGSNPDAVVRRKPAGAPSTASNRSAASSRAGSRGSRRVRARWRDSPTRWRAGRFPRHRSEARGAGRCGGAVELILA